MTSDIRHTVPFRLSLGKKMDGLAKHFQEVVVEKSDVLYGNNEDFSIEAQGPTDFAVIAHGRRVVGHYSVRFSTGENKAIGRYEFFLMPHPFSPPDAGPESLFSFEINSSGEFKIGAFNGVCDPDEYQRAQVRNSVALYVIDRLQQKLSV